MKGQAIVEFALVTPIMLLLLLGMAGVFYLDQSTRKMQEGIEFLARRAAADPGSWRSSVASENARTDCNADPLQPDAEITDQGTAIMLTWHCHLVTDWIFDGTPIDVQFKAFIAPEPTPAAT